MKLDDFESMIEGRILERGYEYYQDGCVVSLEETAPYNFLAKVEGSDLYHVFVELDDKNNILASECDCPYDLGETCKHEVAAYFALHERNKNIILGHGVTQDELKNPQKKGIKKLLDNASQEALVNFLMTLAEESEEMKTRIELAFGDENDHEEVKRCLKLIHSYIHKNSDRHGFIGYHQMEEALVGTGIVLEKSREALSKGRIQQAVRLALLVIGEAVEMIQYGDDSAGGIGEVVAEGFTILDEVSNLEELPESIQGGIFALIMEEAKNPRYREWRDWQMDLLHCCASLTVTPAERACLENYLDSLMKANQKNNRPSEYLTERILLFQYELLYRFEGEAQAEVFLNQCLDYSEFREMALRQAAEKGDEEKVIRLCLEGEEKDKSRNLLGLVDRWREYRYQSYIRTGQLDNRRSLALEFVQDGSFRHYQELKSTYSPEEWSNVYPDIMESSRRSKNRFLGIYSQILVEEGQWDQLMQYVRANPTIIELYYKHLLADYREEVYRIFRQNIEQAAVRANTRSHYRRVCAIIRTLQKAGGKEEARQVVQSLILKYPRRPAFRDELGKLKL